MNRTEQSEEDEDDCVVQKSTGKKMAVKPIANTGKEEFSENTDHNAADYSGLIVVTDRFQQSN